MAHAQIPSHTPRPTPAQTKPLGRNGFKYRPQFGLVVICRDERHQAELFRSLQRDGHRVRVVVV